MIPSTDGCCLFERYAAVFKYIQIVTICICCSTIVNCTILFRIFGILIALKKKLVQSSKIFQNLSFLVSFAWRLGPIKILKFTKNIVVLPRVATNLVLSRKCEFNLVDPFTGPHMYQVRLPKNQSLWVMWLNIFGRNSPEIPF